MEEDAIVKLAWTTLGTSVSFLLCLWFRDDLNWKPNLDIHLFLLLFRLYCLLVALSIFFLPFSSPWIVALRCLYCSACLCCLCWLPNDVCLLRARGFWFRMLLFFFSHSCLELLYASLSLIVYVGHWCVYWGLLWVAYCFSSSLTVAWTPELLCVLNVGGYLVLPNDEEIPKASCWFLMCAFVEWFWTGVA